MISSSKKKQLFWNLFFCIFWWKKNLCFYTKVPLILNFYFFLHSHKSQITKKNRVLVEIQKKIKNSHRHIVASRLRSWICNQGPNSQNCYKRKFTKKKKLPKWAFECHCNKDLYPILKIVKQVFENTEDKLLLSRPMHILFEICVSFPQNFPKQLGGNEKIIAKKYF